MGSPISPLIANLFKEEFEVKALNSCPHPPSLWVRFVDDTYVITKAEHSQPLLQHINNQDPHIQFTVDEPTQHGTLPFLDTLVTIESNNTFSTTVYRKPTHTDQYLHWDSNHHITAKESVYNTLAHRAKTVSSKKQSLDKELQQLKGPYKHVSSQIGYLTNYMKGSLRTIRPTRAPVSPTIPLKTTTPTTTLRRGTSPWWSLTFKAQVRSLKIYANPKVYRYISRVPTHSELN